MITLKELLRDPVYRKYFLTKPRLYGQYNDFPDFKPWALAIQKQPHGQWAYKDYHDFMEAFNKLKKYVPVLNDAAIISKATGCPPPRVNVAVEGKFFVRGKKKIQVTQREDWRVSLPMGEDARHRWCPFCRRPTVFTTFIYHPRFPSSKSNGMLLDPDMPRCTICGASENLVSTELKFLK